MSMTDTTNRTSEHNANQKGLVPDGECNRTACANHPACWWNPHTQAYYCEPCAIELNKHLRAQNLKPLTMERFWERVCH